MTPVIVNPNDRSASACSSSSSRVRRSGNLVAPSPSRDLAETHPPRLVKTAHAIPLARVRLRSVSESLRFTEVAAPTHPTAANQSPRAYRLLCTTHTLSLLME